MRENALTAAKTVRWAASAEVRDVATGALENVALCDALGDSPQQRPRNARAAREAEQIWRGLLRENAGGCRGGGDRG